ncbi:hypothetical protein [Marinobacter zhanjiangensis]|uniref:Uncharacterized protein n=1 Tax=Marinobacter zhanjiangensis TaxID=578215 RepID=A0ABQ3B2L1_9GAMM|nr:hypothetical protein [Marinobacter zhanjiangensis]GGY76300.1 hypothetical protein GCM10007071_24660 [Marinobacter zhanjiangensis]
MKSDKSSESTQPLSPQMKQATLLASEQLTRSEIDLLRQKKKRISASYQKVVEERIKQRIA